MHALRLSEGVCPALTGLLACWFFVLRFVQLHFVWLVWRRCVSTRRTLLQAARLRQRGQRRLLVRVILFWRMGGVLLLSRRLVKTKAEPQQAEAEEQTVEEDQLEEERVESGSNRWSQPPSRSHSQSQSQQQGVIGGLLGPALLELPAAAQAEHWRLQRSSSSSAVSAESQQQEANRVP